MGINILPLAINIHASTLYQVVGWTASQNLRYFSIVTRWVNDLPF